MKTTIKVEKEVEIKYLKVKAGVRYWEDATVNGVEDEKGDLIPCRDGDLWCPLIDIDSGLITNWNAGTEASVHFKVCDAGEYFVQDQNHNTVIEIHDYVPNTLCPKGRGYGDYIIMDIDKDGFIKDWSFEISDFIEE